MARNGEASKVNLENSLEDENLTMDELAQVFEELQSKYENVMVNMMTIMHFSLPISGQNVL